MKAKLLIFQLFCLADQYYYYIARGQIMLLVSGKGAWEQILNFEVYQITDEMKREHMLYNLNFLSFSLVGRSAHLKNIYLNP